MTSSITASRQVARVLAILLWIVGSAYLIRSEIGAQSPDWVVIAATPIVWAVVLVLPVLASHAIRERQIVAALLLIVSALVGTAYTLSGTLSRQSEARDARVGQAAADMARRADLERKLREAEAMLSEARAKMASECATGAGKRCSGVKATLDVYEGAVAGHRHSLSLIRVEAPQAGERRIAAALALMLGGTAEAYMPAVGLFLPTLFGLLVELAALACGMYGWHSRQNRPATVRTVSDTAGQSDYPAISATAAATVLPFHRSPRLPDDRDGGLGLDRRPDAPAPGGTDGRKEEVLAALLTDLAMGRTFSSQREMQAKFGVARSTLSDWLREWEADGAIPSRRPAGRTKALAKALASA